MNIDKAKKEMENVNTRLDDDELEQAAGGEMRLWMFSGLCPKCHSHGHEYSKQQNRTFYKCEGCGHTWSE